MLLAALCRGLRLLCPAFLRSNLLGSCAVLSVSFFLGVFFFSEIPWGLDRASAEEAPAAAPSPDGTASPNGTASSNETADQSVHVHRFGAMLHLSGDIAAEGTAFREGIELALAEAGARAGSPKVEVVFEDTGYDAARTNSAAMKLLTDTALKGAFISTLHEAKPVLPLLEKSHLPTLVLWDSSTEIEDAGDYVFGIGPWTADTGRKAADFVSKTLKLNSVALLSTNNEWSAAVQKAFFDRSLKLGLNIAGLTAVNPQDKDFLTIISKMRNSGAQAVYAPLSANHVSFAKQLRAANFELPIIMADALSPALLNEAPRVFEGFYQTMLEEPSGPLADQLKSSYSAKYGKAPEFPALTALGYDGMKLFLWTLENGGTSRETIKDTMYRVKDFPGAGGKITMSEKGSAPKFPAVYQVKQNALQLVEAPDGAEAK